MAYFLPYGYIERMGAPQDFDVNGTDEWQREVYMTAVTLAEVFGLRTVLDFGCGSGFKLMKYFSNYETLGVDLPEAVVLLAQKYPGRRWSTTADLSSALFTSTLTHPDMLICSDVIEHVDDPDLLLSFFKAIHPQWLVISTPDRKLMAKYPKWTSENGPPGNGCHVREWAFDEFRRYMDSHFEVLRHFRSNVKQATQCIIARPKGE
jgi:hypothetical protein